MVDYYIYENDSQSLQLLNDEYDTNKTSWLNDILSLLDVNIGNIL